MPAQITVRQRAQTFEIRKQQALRPKHEGRHDPEARLFVQRTLEPLVGESAWLRELWESFFLHSPDADPISEWCSRFQYNTSAVIIWPTPNVPPTIHGLSVAPANHSKATPAA